ncbi:MAG: tandem-95 repeat protein, partial [Rubripirellula sp.]|nr:tandem-95 repeat protein [Rubripirellula sp.]
QVFLEGIAASIRAAIQNEVDNGLLDLDVAGDGVRIVLGAEPGATASTENTGMQQLPRTLALRVPTQGVNALGGIVDGDTFQIDSGGGPVTFEFDTGNGIASPLNQMVSVVDGDTAVNTAIAIKTAIDNAGMGLNSSIEDDGLSVYLNLPLDGAASVEQGQLALVGLSRPALDEEEIIITPSDGISDPVIFEINRTDERDGLGNEINPGIGDGVTAPNIAIDLNRATTGDDFAALVANAIQGLNPVAGLNPAEVEVISGGVLQVGGEEGLGLAVEANSIEVTGAPSVSGPSTVEVAGPLLLGLPLVGGAGILDGSVMVLTADNGDEVIFEFNLNGSGVVIPTAVPVPYNQNDLVDTVASNLALVINGVANLGITATNLPGGEVSFGRISESRVNIEGIFDPLGTGISAPGLNGAELKRGIVNDGEILVISQGAISVSYEFEAVAAGGGVTTGNVAVPFTADSTPGQVALALTSAINNNKLGLSVEAVAELDPATGLANGKVLLNDKPGTVVDISAAPTLEKSGVPGGAIAISYSPLFGTNEIKLAMIEAINSVNQPDEPAVTSLSAEDRGGDTFFVSNASLLRGVAGSGGIVANFSLPGVQDIAGNKLEANRPDFSTRFTILMPTAKLDFGDAPDPVNLVNGRYPTKLVNNGPRHVVGNGPLLGDKIDANLDGLPGITANRDDVAIAVQHDSVNLFSTALSDGGAAITITTPAGSDPDLWDGDTFTLDLGTAQATFEYDVLTDNSGAFDEDNYAIRPVISDSALSIAEAIQVAIAEATAESNFKFNPASVVISGDALSATVNVSADDEDGVSFISDFNPLGVLNHGIYLPIEVDVTGAGVLEGWIDFNADGDWDDPGEQILPMVFDPATQALRDQLLPVNETGAVSNIFADTGGTSTRIFNIVVPPTTPIPPSALTTYARFRVSKEGGLGPDGLSLSGEVEDYSIRLLPGLPPEIQNPEVLYDHVNLAEDAFFVADGVGGNPAGLLDGINVSDPDGVAIYVGDRFTDEMLQVDPDGPSGPISPVDAGILNMNADGTFDFQPEPDFNGAVTFTVRVVDQPADPALQLVNSTPLTVTLDVSAVNDAPVAINPPVVVAREINEDEVAVFNITDVDPAQSLIDGKYLPGNSTSVDEMNQPMKILEAGTLTGSVYLSEQGGNVTVSADGSTITYTPPENYNGNVAPGNDSFTYVVIDEPGAGFTAQQSADVGTVNITFVAVNDPPVAVDDSYNATENEDLVIPLTGNVGGVDGIFNNDSGGPSDEDQSLALKSTDFPQVTSQGGTVVYDAVSELLTYSPAPNFSGIDTFTYTAVDGSGSESELPATVTITVAGVDDSPVFLGVDGQAGVSAITRDEAKIGGETVTYDLNTWFIDPEGASLTYTSSTNPNPTSLFTHEITANVLTLELAAFENGAANLLVTADDGSTGTTATILVTLNDTPDGPLVITSQNPFPVVGDEDTLVTQDLSFVFSDPDGDSMVYHVTELGALINPTVSQILDHELVQAIDFAGDEMTITLQPNQHGSVNFRLEADDQDSATPNAGHEFLLTVNSEPDFPVAVDDGYVVPIGSALQVTNVSEALLGNDYDPDGDEISFNLVVVDPTEGTVAVNTDGTFTYTNNQGTIGGTDTFTYNIVDSTSKESNVATVTITFEASAYQNPTPGLRDDVNADGFVTALDALRIINFLSVQGSPNVPVSVIGSAPPDYLDTTGNGAVSSLDALSVLNTLALQGGSGEGEFAAQNPAGLGVTSSFVAASRSGLPVRDMQLANSLEVASPLDQLLANGLNLNTAALESAVQGMEETDSGEAASADSVDQVLSSVLDEIDMGLTVQ